MAAKKRVIIPIAITIVAISIFIGVWLYISQNNYVFKINGQKITMNEYSTYLTLQKKQMESQSEHGKNIWNMLINEAPAIETARNNAKISMIDTVTKVQKAKERKISLTNEEKDLIREAAEYYVEALNEVEITKEEFIKINEDGLLIEKLILDLYKAQDHSAHPHGKIDMESYEKGIQSPDIKFTSRHILFSTEGMNTEDARKVEEKAQGVLNRLLNGSDFATLAKEYSEDPGSKDNGGLYEDIPGGSFVPEYEDALFEINPGEIYPKLVKTSYGYHIIKLENVVNPEGYIGLNAAREVIASEFNEIANTWIKEAEVEVNEQPYNSAV